MDLKISFLSVIRVIFSEKCFFTQIPDLCISDGQLFNISNRFYITFDTFFWIILHLLMKIQNYFYTFFVSGLLAGNAIPVSLILISKSLSSHWTIHVSFLTSGVPIIFCFRSLILKILFFVSLVFFWWSYITTVFLICQYFYLYFYIYFCYYFICAFWFCVFVLVFIIILNILKLYFNRVAPKSFMQNACHNLWESKNDFRSCPVGLFMQ